MDLIMMDLIETEYNRSPCFSHVWKNVFQGYETHKTAKPFAVWR